MYGQQVYVWSFYWPEGNCTFTIHYCYRIINSRYPYFPAVDDNIALSHIAALLGSAGLKDAAQSLGRRLTISELPESTEPVQQIVKHQRLSSKITLDEGIFFILGRSSGQKTYIFTRGPGVQGTVFPIRGRNFGTRLKLNFLDKIETTGSEWREVTDLLIQLLQPNPKNRPNACQALDMEFFTKHS